VPSINQRLTIKMKTGLLNFYSQHYCRQTDKNHFLQFVQIMFAYSAVHKRLKKNWN